MSKRRTPKRSASQMLFWLLSLIMVASMVISLVIVALQPPPRPTPTLLPTLTPPPTWTPTTAPTATPSPTLESPPASGEPTGGVQGTATEPAEGPQLPTATSTPTAAGLSLGASLSPAVAVQATAAPAGLRFAVCGDSRGGPQIYRCVLESVAADGAEFLIHTGDLVNKGTEAQWSKFEALMADFALPFCPVPGNHDALDGELDGYLAHSGAPAAHYSFDRSSVHFCLADSHHGGVTAAELDWMRKDLGATSQPVKIVALHHPPFDPDGSDHIMAFGNKKFMGLMVQMGVDYVFTGHIHAYARGERDGVHYVITGGAGAPLYTTGHPRAVNHYLLVTVQGEDVTVDLVEV